MHLYALGDIVWISRICSKCIRRLVDPRKVSKSHRPQHQAYTNPERHRNTLHDTTDDNGVVITVTPQSESAVSEGVDYELSSREAELNYAVALWTAFKFAVDGYLLGLRKATKNDCANENDIGIAPTLRKTKTDRPIASLHSTAQRLHCAHCGEVNIASNLLRCSKCRSTYYCSKEHQRAGWMLHKVWFERDNQPYFNNYVCFLLL